MDTILLILISDIVYCINELKVVVEWLALLLRIREVPGSISARKQAVLMFYVGSLSHSRQMPDYCLTLRYDRFLAHSRHFLFNLSPLSSVL
jgi:hypothetical protein